jgi:hypothetical protein
LLATAALGAMIAGAAAKDLPATPEGAAKVASFFQTYAGKAAGAPPALVVTPEGSDYAVAIDIGLVTSATKTVGVVYDPAIVKFKIFEQDDGAWRLEQSEFTPLTGHSTHKDKTTTFSITVGGYKGVVVLDPAISWLRGSDVSSQTAEVHVTAPGVDETVGVGALRGSAVGKAAPDGAVATTATETFGAFDLKMKIDPKETDPSAKPDAKPVDVAARGDGGTVDVKMTGLKPRPLLDLWAFLVAHPTRPERADNEAALKGLMTAALAEKADVDETVSFGTLTVTTEQGPFVLEGFKIGVDGAAAGAASRFGEHFAATGLKLPAGLVPAAYLDLVPTSFDFGFEVGGLDLTAAGAEAIQDIHWAGDAPPISPEDKNKAFAKLVGGGPVVIDIPHSSLRAPKLDVTFEGQIRYVGGKPLGAITVRARDFDTSVTALKALGPDAEAKLVPVLAMAKGLAKAGPDGALTWVCEVGADRVMKVNGLPLGKAPF